MQVDGAVNTKDFVSLLWLKLDAMPRDQLPETVAAIMNVLEPPKRPHNSDCRINNAPVYMPGWCVCGAIYGT